MRSDVNSEKLAKAWDDELKKKKPSVLRAIYKIYGFKVVFLGFVYSIADTIAR